MTEREIQAIKKWYEDYEIIKQYKKDIESGEWKIAINLNVASLKDELIELLDRQMNALKGAFCSYTGTEIDITEFEDKRK